MAQPSFSSSDARGSAATFSSLHNGSHASECDRARLYDNAACCAGGERGRGWSSRQVGPLLATDNTLADAKSHRRRLIKREDRAMRAQYVGVYEYGKRETLNNKQQVLHRDTGNFDWRVDIAANLSAGAFNADNVRCSASERLD